MTMHRTINIWIVVVVCICALAAFGWYNRSLNASLEELDAAYDSAKVRLTQMQGEQAELEVQAQTVGTDSFVENQARTLYGYIMPDEVRFVIDNPEALYGDESIPSP